MANIKHKMYGTPTYKSWAEMKYRVKNKKSYCYGKTICEEWKRFENFYNDMGKRPAGKSIDRIDNNRGYSKENCRWATGKEQCRNKKNNILLKGKTLSEWSEILGIKRSTLAQRYYVYGWSVNRTLLIKK